MTCQLCALKHFSLCTCLCHALRGFEELALGAGRATSAWFSIWTYSLFKTWFKYNINSIISTMRFRPFSTQVGFTMSFQYISTLTWDFFAFSPCPSQKTSPPASLKFQWRAAASASSAPWPDSVGRSCWNKPSVFKCLKLNSWRPPFLIQIMIHFWKCNNNLHIFVLKQFFLIPADRTSKGSHIPAFWRSGYKMIGKSLTLSKTVLVKPFQSGVTLCCSRAFRKLQVETPPVKCLVSWHETDADFRPGDGGCTQFSAQMAAENRTSKRWD